MSEPIAEMIQFAGRFAGEVDRGGGDGFRQGVVVAWDSITNANTIAVGGGLVTNIPTLSTADSIMMSVGDSVALLKFKSSFYILGRITPPGASNAFGMKSASIATQETTTSATYTDLTTVGPTLNNVYIGTSRRCLVLISATIGLDQLERGTINVAVTGVSTIVPPAAGFGAVLYHGNPNFSTLSATITKPFLIDASVGLNSGLNTFTMKYAAFSGGAPAFSDRSITLFPF